MTRRGSERERDAAFDRLFREHRQSVLAYFLRRVDAPSDAADLLAEVFLVVWRRLDDVPAGGEAAPWLFGVARRVLANHRRGVRRRDGLAVRLRSTLDRGAVPSPEAASDDEAVARLRRALETLPEIDREIVTLRAWEALSASDIAVVVGGTPENVRVRLHRARSRLRSILDLPEVLEEQVVP